jgi:pimeloyl-ACP methyl ester esterase
MPFLSHAGVSLRYDRTGSGPVVLLLHGWTGNRSFWERQVSALRDRFTVVTVDLRGHGESSPVRTGYSLGSLAADVEHLVRALRVPRLALVGWSMGGMLAQMLAHRLGDRVTALGLVCTTAGGLSDPANPLADPGTVRTMQAEIAADYRGFLRRFAARLFAAGDAAPLYPWALGQMQKTPPHVALACLETLAAVDLRPTLRALAAPATVFHGRHDGILPLAHGEALARALPDARLVVLDGSAHAPLLEEPEAFNEALLALLSGSRPPAAAAPEPPRAKRSAAPRKAAAPKKR